MQGRLYSSGKLGLWKKNCELLFVIKWIQHNKGLTFLAWVEISNNQKANKIFDEEKGEENQESLMMKWSQ